MSSTVNARGNPGNSTRSALKRGKRKTQGQSALGSSIVNSSKLSGSSVRHGNTQSASHGTSIRVVIDGQDMTPLSLLDEGESLAISGSGSKNAADKTNGSLSGFGSEIRGVPSSGLGNPSSGRSTGHNDPSRPESCGSMPQEDENSKNRNNGMAKREEDMLRRGRLRKQITGVDSTEVPSSSSGVDLEELITMELHETPTETLFSLSGVCVGLESSDHPIVSERNVLYGKLCDSKEGSDLYTARPTQTLNEELKSIEVSTGFPPVQDTGCQITSWDIHDNIVADNVEEESHTDSLLVESKSETPVEDEEEATGKGEDIPKQKISLKESLGSSIASIRVSQVEKLVASSMVSDGCLLPIEETKESDENNNKSEDSASPPQDQGTQTLLPGAEEILESRELIESLRIIERGIQQNVFYEKHLLYRAMPVADEEYQNSQKNDLDRGMIEGEDEEGLDVDTDALEALQEESVALDGSISVADQDDATAQGETVEGEGNNLGAAESTISEEPSSPEGLQDGLLDGVVDPTSAAFQRQAEEEPELQLLWQFQCEEANGRTVSDMCWNKVNQDLLAVSYCQFQFANQRDGVILFWTLKNPEYPERSIKCDSGVCSIDFSGQHPSLLAAGMYDGTVAIYDLHREGEKGNKPVLDSSKMSTQHKDAVWQVKWVNKSERGEVLVSLSTDGRVTEWSLKKGLAGTDLMVLKRVHVPTELGGSGEGIISRTAAGLSLDFPINDPGIYYTGTEDGTIHRCSCSYNEQYLETYFGHSGPVYKLRCSPFWAEAFLTCSADWSVRLWEPEHDQPLLHFQSVDLADVVHDVAWSTSQSTVFGSVAGDGRIEIWDLSKNTLDPVITYFIDPASERKVKLRRNTSFTAASPPDPPPANVEEGVGIDEENVESTATEKTGKSGTFYSSVKFAYNAPIVVAGSSQGVIDVFRVRGLNSTYDSEEEATAHLQRIVEQNQK